MNVGALKLSSVRSTVLTSCAKDLFLQYTNRLTFSTCIPLYSLTEDEETTCDSNKYCDNLDVSGLSALDEMNIYFKKLGTFDIKEWSTEDTMGLLCVMTEFEESEYLSHDFYAGNALFEILRLWKPTSSTATNLFCALCESNEIEMAHLIICLVSYPGRLDDFDCFLGEMLYHLYSTKPEVWNVEWIAELLGKLEGDLECCDVDAVEVLFSFGKQLKDPAKLGKLAHSYLLATGLQNSFECRCKTAECFCPVEVDEGVAFILFEGLVRKLRWSISEKRIFFRQAVEKLFGPNVLTELGNYPAYFHKSRWLVDVAQTGIEPRFVRLGSLLDWGSL